MKAKEIINIMDMWANPSLIDSWDNTGFQIGDEDKKVNKILLSLDLDRKSLDMAIDGGYDMIINHHPLIFKPLKSINSSSPKGKMILDIIRNDIIVYNAHSNLDLAKNGVNDELANLIDLKDIKILRETVKENLVKLAVYTPKTHAGQVRKSLGDIGVGHIGDYSHCTFNGEGIGTFLPMENTNPYIGSIGKIEEVEEIKIETILREEDIDRVLTELMNVHPYEEVAYDLYPLLNKGESYGYGRIGEIEEIELMDFAGFIKDALETENITIYGQQNRKIKRVALCGGSGSEFIIDAYKSGADVYITGDIKYHDAQLAHELGLTIIDAGHYHTEKVILPVIKKYLKDKIDKSMEVKVLMEPGLPYKVY